jgi:hypothetical protein
MKETWDYARCVWVLKGEITLLREIAAAQDGVREAVMNRQWTDFDGKTEEINRIGGEFARLESERVQLFEALSGGSGEKPFYALINPLPSGERRELSGLYRELKMETLKMRAVNEAFLAYLNEAKTLAAAYLEAVCPERGGKLYTRRGNKVSQDLRSIILNSRF